MLGNPNFSCWLDQNNIITSVSMPQWDEFALANDGAEATADKVIGRNLRSFIVGFMTLMWLESLLELVRNKKVGIDCSYRCDAPTEKRYMKMSISPQGNGQLYLAYYLLETRPITPPLRFNYALATASLNVERCSVCNRIRSKDAWFEPEVAVKKGLIGGVYSLPVGYTVCHECMFQLHNLRYHFA